MPLQTKEKKNMRHNGQTISPQVSDTMRFHEPNRVHDQVYKKIIHDSSGQSIELFHHLRITPNNKAK
jgi:hypothetical protein